MINTSHLQNALPLLSQFGVPSLGYLSRVCDDPLRLCNAYGFLPECIYSLVVFYSYGVYNLIFQAFIPIQTNFILR